MPRGRSASLEPEELTYTPRRSTRLSRNLHVDSPAVSPRASKEESKPMPVRRTRRSMSTQSETSDVIVVDKDLQPTRRSTRLTKEKTVEEKVDLTTPSDKENEENEINKPKRRSTRSMSKSPTTAVRVTPTKQKKAVPKRRLAPADKQGNEDNILEVISETEEIQNKVSDIETNNNQNKNKEKELNTSNVNLNVSESEKIVLHISDDEEDVNIQEEKTTDIKEVKENHQETENHSEIIEERKITSEKVLEKISENNSFNLVKSNNIVKEIDSILTAIERKTPEIQLNTEDTTLTSQNTDSSTEKLESDVEKSNLTNSEIKTNETSHSAENSSTNVSFSIDDNVKNDITETAEILSEEVENISQTDKTIHEIDNPVASPRKSLSEVKNSEKSPISNDKDLIEKNDINESFKKPDLVKNATEDVSKVNNENSDDETESNISIVGSTSPDSKEKCLSPEKPLVVEVNEEEQDYNLSLVNDDGKSYSPIGKAIDIPTNLDIQLDELICKTNLKLKDKESVIDISRKRRYEVENGPKKRGETESPVTKKVRVASKLPGNLIRFSADDSDSDSCIDVTSSSDEGPSNEFLDDQAIEGSDEDTPSDDSNAIVDHGESIGSTTSNDESYSDEASLEDFVVNDDHVEDDLLSGSEDFLGTEPSRPTWSGKKHKRIIKSLDSSDEESSTGNWSTKAHKHSPVSNQISTIDSDNESIVKRNRKLSEQIENEENSPEDNNTSTENKKIDLNSEESNSELDIINLDSDTETETKNLSKVPNVENDNESESEHILKDFCDLPASEIIENENLLVLNEVNKEIEELKKLSSINEDCTLSASKKRRSQRKKSLEFNKSQEIQKRKSTSENESSPEKRQKTPVSNENSSSKKKKPKSEDIESVETPDKFSSKKSPVFNENSSSKKKKPKSEDIESVETPDKFSSKKSPVFNENSSGKKKRPKSEDILSEIECVETPKKSEVLEESNLKKSPLSNENSSSKKKKQKSEDFSSPIECLKTPKKSPELLKGSSSKKKSKKQKSDSEEQNINEDIANKTPKSSPLIQTSSKKKLKDRTSGEWIEEPISIENQNIYEINILKPDNITENKRSSVELYRFQSIEEISPPKSRNKHKKNLYVTDSPVEKPFERSPHLKKLSQNVNAELTKDTSENKRSSVNLFKKFNESKSEQIEKEELLEDEVFITSAEKQKKKKKSHSEEENLTEDIINVNKKVIKKKSKKSSSNSEEDTKKSSSSEDIIVTKNKIKKSKKKENVKVETSPGGNIENIEPTTRIPKEKKGKKVSVKELINKFEKKSQIEKQKHKTSTMNFKVETETKARATVSELNDITPKKPITKRGYINPSQSGSTNCSKIKVEVLQQSNLNNLSKRIKKKEKKQKYNSVNIKLITASLAGQTSSATNFKEEFLYGNNVKRIDSAQLLKMKKVKH